MGRRFAVVRSTLADARVSAVSGAVSSTLADARVSAVSSANSEIRGQTSNFKSPTSPPAFLTGPVAARLAQHCERVSPRPQVIL